MTFILILSAIIIGMVLYAAAVAAGECDDRNELLWNKEEEKKNL